jgi:hypothetical protein
MQQEELGTSEPQLGPREPQNNTTQYTKIGNQDVGHKSRSFNNLSNQ